MAKHYSNFATSTNRSTINAVLKDVSFFVEQGETAVIMGRSGVGKSVSLKLLLGFLQPDEGRIIVAGAGRYRMDRAAIFGNSPARDDGVSVGRAFRFADGGGKRGVSDGRPRGD